MTAAELVAHGGAGEWLSAAGLEAWLLDARLAEPNGEAGRLVATALAHDIVWLLGWSPRRSPIDDPIVS